MLFKQSHHLEPEIHCTAAHVADADACQSTQRYDLAQVCNGQETGNPATKQLS